MARIRTIKPDFWEDEVVGLLSQGARLLFIATWNLADDEGLLRWTAPYLKASVFMYDHEVSVADVEEMMSELTNHGMVFAYHGGKAKQRLGWVIHFRKHQKINRPQPSKLPPPSLQNAEVRKAYARRDSWTCAICSMAIPDDPTANPDVHPSMDHKTPRINGGSDYPTNIQVAHVSCNKSRRNNGIDHTPEPHILDNVKRAVDKAMSRSVNGSVNGSLPEGKGKEEERERKGKEEHSSKSDELILDMWGVWIDELGGKPPLPRLTRARKQKLQCLYREQLRSTDDPLGVLRRVLAVVKESDHHMGNRAYQMVESIFKNEERRDSWVQKALAPSLSLSPHSSIGANQGSFVIEGEDHAA